MSAAGAPPAPPAAGPPPAAPVAGQPRWLRAGGPGEGETRWSSSLAVTAAVVAQALLPARLLPVGRWLPLVPEVLLALLLAAANPVRLERGHPLLRAAELVLVGIITAATISSAVVLCADVVEGRIHDPKVLLGSGAVLWAVNVIAFGLWYWQFDGGGPVGRLRRETPYPAFLFAQMATPERSPLDWRPEFGDYLYLSLTNVTAFSPTDTLPMTRWAKGLMATQSLTALVLVVLVLARAVNVLAG